MKEGQEYQLPPPWLARRILALAGSLLLIFVAMALLSVGEKSEGAEGSSISEALGLLWLLGLVQLTNVVIVWWFKSRWLRVVVATMWAVIQSAGVAFVFPELARICGITISPSYSTMTTVLALTVYWSLSLMILRAPRGSDSSAQESEPG